MHITSVLLYFVFITFSFCESYFPLFYFFLLCPFCFHFHKMKTYSIYIINNVTAICTSDKVHILSDHNVITSVHILWLLFSRTPLSLYQLQSLTQYNCHCISLFYTVGHKKTCHFYFFDNSGKY